MEGASVGIAAPKRKVLCRGSPSPPVRLLASCHDETST